MNNLVVPHPPNHPRFTHKTARLASFHHWPPSMPVRPDNLAEAGFFYIGQSIDNLVLCYHRAWSPFNTFFPVILGRGDGVKCFHCGGALGGWKLEDCPWEEHAKWYPNCAYLQLVKGKRFVKKVQQKWENRAMWDESMAEETRMPRMPSWETFPPFPEEDIRLNEQHLCRICFIAKTDIAFIPCGHLMTCGRCAVSSLSISRLCPICRTPIQNCLKIFTS